MTRYKNNDISKRLFVYSNQCNVLLCNTEKSNTGADFIVVTMYAVLSCFYGMYQENFRHFTYEENSTVFHYGLFKHYVNMSMQNTAKYDYVLIRTHNLTSRKHLCTKVTPDFQLTYSKNGGNLGLELK